MHDDDISLDSLRIEINEIDTALVELLDKRMHVSGKVAQYKKAHDLPVFDETRERERIQSVQQDASEVLQPYIAPLWRTLMDVSKDYQELVMHPSQYGLVGQTLTHSYSPAIHALIGDYDYELYETEPDQLEDFLLRGPLTGCNVTIPYKETVLAYCAELSSAARRIGCVNTIVRRDDGTLYGDNTDYAGFAYLIEKSGVDIQYKKVCILGTGGASKTAHAVVEDLGARTIVHVSRTLSSQADAVTYGQTSYYMDAQILINTTPVGMYPDCPQSVVNLDHFTQLEAVVDVVYNPVRTGLMLQAEKRGIPHVSGLSMLVVQALKAAQVWGIAQAADINPEALISAIQYEQENIVLIGMPGAGKSSIGKAVAHQLDKAFVDIDAVFVQRQGVSIPDYFTQYGEERFRVLEAQLVQEFGKKSGIVIACGGGVVTQPDNYAALHQNGRIVYIERALTDLETAGRPLSQATSVAQLYAQRREAYESWADYTVINNGTVESAVAQIIETLG